MRAVIFDWDLTLWNSWDIHLSLMERTAADLGVAPPSPAAIAAEFHRPFVQHLLWFLGSRPDAAAEIPGIEAAYLRHYYRMSGHRNYFYPGVASLLRVLKRRGIRIGVLSDKRSEFGLPELAQSGLASLVDYADFKTDARPYKPHPAGLRRSLDALETAAGDAVYVGDAPQDIACAQDAGTWAAAALWAAIDRAAVLELQPDYALHRPHQVMAMLADRAGKDAAAVWRRRLPGPWRPDDDNPADDEDAAPSDPAASLAAPSGPAESLASPSGSAESLASPSGPAESLASAPAGLAWEFWPLASRWRGRSGKLALPPDAANPVAPLALRANRRRP